MNYRHEFHAGNFADVMKHIAVVLVIERLKLKDKPFLFLDTHAGAGAYDLSSDEAARGGEWQAGIGRLLEAVEAGNLQAAIVAELKPYIDTINSFSANGNSRLIYPGSSVLAAGLIRHQDRLIANELHPEAATRLRRSLRSRARTRVTQSDGWALIKSALPPPERRGLVLVDPPFEEPNEFTRLVDALREGGKRFATGVYLLWYPIKDRKVISRFHRKLIELGHPDLQAFELLVQADRLTAKMHGCGLVVANPPFGFASAYSRILERLANLFAIAPGAKSATIGLSHLRT